MKTQILKSVNLPWKFHEKHYLTCDLYYDAGGYNWYNKAEEPRGYYISVCRSVEQVAGIISVFPTSGVKESIITCKRRTGKQDTKAIVMFADKVKRIISLAFPDMDIDYTGLDTTVGEERAA